MSLLLPRRRCFLSRQAAQAGGGGGATLLLDDGDVPSCDLAFSHDRKLRDAYAGSIWRERRSSDSAEVDVGFTSNRVDVTSAESHLGMDDGFLPKSYDQTANARDVSQTTGANQPAVATSGALSKDADNRYYMTFDGSASVISRATWSLVQPCTVVMVMQLLLDAANDTLFDGSSTNTMRLYMTSTAGVYRMFSGSGTTNLNGPQVSDGKALIIAEFNGASSKFYWNNGTAQASGTTGTSSPGGIVIGGRTTTPNDPANFNLYELLVFPSTLDAAALSAIRTNINAHYSIW